VPPGAQMSQPVNGTQFMMPQQPQQFQQYRQSTFVQPMQQSAPGTPVGQPQMNPAQTTQAPQAGPAVGHAVTTPPPGTAVGNALTAPAQPQVQAPPGQAVSPPSATAASTSPPVGVSEMAGVRSPQMTAGTPGQVGLPS